MVERLPLVVDMASAEAFCSDDKFPSGIANFKTQDTVRRLLPIFLQIDAMRQKTSETKDV